MRKVDNELFDKIENLAIEARDRRRALNSELSRVDKEITDIEHYIEFYSFSASRGYELSKMLKDRLDRRREIKNEMELLNDISCMQMGYIANGKGRKKLEKRADKQYIPRVLKELFKQ